MLYGNHCRIRQLKENVSKNKAFSCCYMATTENKSVSRRFAIKVSVGSPERFLLGNLLKTKDLD